MISDNFHTHWHLQTLQGIQKTGGKPKAATSSRDGGSSSNEESGKAGGRRKLSGSAGSSGRRDSLGILIGRKPVPVISSINKETWLATMQEFFGKGQIPEEWKG